MKKVALVSLSLVLLLAWGAVPAFSWGSATHAYIAGRIGKILPLMNANETYGVMAPDIFNYVFTLTPDEQSAIGFYTHGTPGSEGFMQVWSKAKWWGFQKSLAYGFVAHNDVWGIDSTAHHSGIIIGQGVGYVILKAGQLLEKPISTEGLLPGPGQDVPLYMIFAYLGLTNPADQLDLAHEIFESAGDIYLAQKDRMIGQKMAGAALVRSNDFPGLLASVMTPIPKDFIFAAEKEFRKTMVLYGYSLMQDQDTAILNMADMYAQLGSGYLQAKGVTPPDPAVLRLVAERIIRAALPLCNDYMTEVNATVKFVKAQLALHNVRY